MDTYSRLSDWKQILAQRIPLYGHRNWIAVVDSAYPLQTSPGVETIIADTDLIEAVQHVLDALASADHVRPRILIDDELDHVGEDDAPGVTAYRSQLLEILARHQVQPLPHERIISQLGHAGATFHVLVIKTTMAIPYTSVFLQLDCKYWSDEAEQRLRARLSTI